MKKPLFNLFLGIKLPQTNPSKLLKNLQKLSINSQKSMYFLYSEFLLRSNRNICYQKTLKKANFLAIDGKGLLWSQFKVCKKTYQKLSLENMLPKLFARVLKFEFLPKFIVVIIFYFLFTGQLVINIFSLAKAFLLKFNFQKYTQNQLVLGRDFFYDLLDLASQKGWKTVILAGGIDKAKILAKLRQRFDNLEVDIWLDNPNSELMRDISKVQKPLSSHNLYQAFPKLKKALDYLKNIQPDLILVSIGGASGKQEFFVDSLKKHDLDFTLATGIGAAVDHLGGGKQQSLSPKWMQKLGLEWAYRFYKLPYRRKRVWDSVYTLWWWTSLQEFGFYTRVCPESLTLGSYIKLALGLSSKAVIPEA